MNFQRIYPLGAANPEIARMVQAVAFHNPQLSFPGLLDNDVAKHGLMIGDLEVLGGSEMISSLNGDDVRFVSLVTGTTRARYETGVDIVQRGGVLSNLIHPNVNLIMTTLGLGNYIQESVVIQAGVEIGMNSSIHMAALVGHETSIGDHVFIAHGACISGSCRIENGAFVGANATVLPRISIGKWSTVGAGSVVTKDVPDFAIVVGNPARIIDYSYQNSDLEEV
jgi:sugar O-acyltransferase (sialic acid O-acetyltransferase NeuD family)